jgi:hypothetical protein
VCLVTGDSGCERCCERTNLYRLVRFHDHYRAGSGREEVCSFIRRYGHVRLGQCQPHPLSTLTPPPMEEGSERTQPLKVSEGCNKARPQRDSGTGYACSLSKDTYLDISSNHDIINESCT